jgi:uncharacterized protein
VTVQAVTEHALTFECEGDTLCGILHEPTMPTVVGMVVIVGGPQYRVGSHRQFVLLSRAMAKAGFAVLRFDARGMGDSTGSPRSFEDLDTDIAAAIDVLMCRLPTVRAVALAGLCDGASAALIYCRRRSDNRVAGLCLLNPWLRSPESLARTHIRHYYPRRLMQSSFWLKLLRGEVPRQALSRLVCSILLTRHADYVRNQNESTDFRSTMAAGWMSYHGSILLILSGNDYTANEFIGAVESLPAWRNAFSAQNLTRCDLHSADHTLSRREDRLAMESAVLDWLALLCPPHFALATDEAYPI